MKRRLSFTILFVLCGMKLLSAQDLHFSQFRMSPVLLNPATSGVFKGDFRGILNYKNQWASLGAPYQTFAFSGDGKLFQEAWDGSHLGVSGVAYRDRAGDAGYGTTRAKVGVSYNLAVERGQYLSGGLQLAYDQISLDRSALKWGNQYDGTGHNPDLPSKEDRSTSGSSSLDVGMGLDWRTFSSDASMSSTEGYWFEVGAAVHHLARPDRSLYEKSEAKVHTKYVGHVDGSFGFSNSPLAFLPGAMYAHQGPAQELVYGGMLRYQFTEEAHFTGLEKGASISMGLHHRFGDAIITNLRLEYAQYSIGLSYDVNVSGLSTATNSRGGFEISLRYLTPDPFVPNPGSKTSPRF